MTEEGKPESFHLILWVSFCHPSCFFYIFLISLHLNLDTAPRPHLFVCLWHTIRTIFGFSVRQPLWDFTDVSANHGRCAIFSYLLFLLSFFIFALFFFCISSHKICTYILCVTVCSVSMDEQYIYIYLFFLLMFDSVRNHFFFSGYFKVEV